MYKQKSERYIVLFLENYFWDFKVWKSNFSLESYVTGYHLYCLFNFFSFSGLDAFLLGFFAGHLKLSYLPNPSARAQGQFLSRAWQVWIQSFPSPRLVASPRLKNPSILARSQLSRPHWKVIFYSLINT